MTYVYRSKSKDVPRQAKVALGVPGRLRPRIIWTFGTTRVVGRQPCVPAAFIPRRNPWYSLSEAESTSGHMVLSEGTTEKIPSDATGNRFRDHIVTQRLNHYATPGPNSCNTSFLNILPITSSTVLKYIGLHYKRKSSS